MFGHMDFLRVTAMSIRASLSVGAGAKAKEVAEAKTWIPLCWLPLSSAGDIARGIATGCFTVHRGEAIGRLDDAVPFLAGLFPEFQNLPDCAGALLAVLRRSRATTIDIELADHFASSPETFPVALAAAVQAIKARDASGSLTVPARQIPNPFGGKPITIKATTFRTTREVLCHTTGIDPVTDDEAIERDQLIGYLL